MKLVWRLFLKDQRVLCWWIVAWIAIQLASAIAEYAAWLYPLDLGMPVISWLVGGFLIALLIHQEPVASKGVSFWGTRPLQHRHLLLGKSLFILLYFVLIPLFIKLVILWLTGFSGYIVSALIEWGTTYVTILLVALAVAIIAPRLAHILIVPILGWIGLAILKAAVESLKRQLDWNPAMTLWWDFPSAPLIAHFTLAFGAIVIVLNQYMTGNRRLSWLGAVVTLLLVAAVGLLPITSHPYRSHHAKLPPSDPALDAAVEDLAKDLSRLSPLPTRYQPIGEQNGLSIVRLERHPVDSTRKDPRLFLTVDRSRTKVQFGNHTLNPIVRNPMHFSSYPQYEEFLRVTDNEDQITPFLHQSSRIDLMEYDARGMETFAGQAGTLRAELYLTRAEPEFSFRMPLEVGAETRIGPCTLTISDIGREGSALRIRTVEYYPRRKWTTRWAGLPSSNLGSSNAHLYHTPTKTVIAESFDGGSGSGHGSWPSSWMCSESEKTFSITNGRYSIERALLAPENFDATEWEVVGISMANKAAKKVHLEIPHFRLGWEAADTVEAFAQQLENIQLPDFESAEAYLWAVWHCWSDYLPRGSEVPLISEKLAVLQPDHVEALIRVMRNHPQGDFNLRPFLKVLRRLIRAEHKQLILDNHDTTFDLLQPIIDQGWEQEAIPIMVAKAQTKYPPKSWIDFLIDRRPLDKELWFSIARRSFQDQTIRDVVSKIPNFPYERLVDLRWKHLKNQSPWDDALKDVLTFGRPYALPTLRYIVKARHYYRSSEPEPPILVELLSTMSDCPNDLEQAEAWLETHAETASFDPETKRYVTAQPKEAP